MPTSPTHNDPSGADRGKLAGFVGWTFGGGLTAKAAVMVTTLAAARALTPLQFGEYVGLTAAALLACGLWDLGVSALITVELASNRISMRLAIWQVMRLRLRTAAIWLIAIAAGVAIIDRQRDIPWPAMAAFAAASLCASTSLAVLAILRARFAFRRAAFCVSIGRWLTAVISLSALPIIGLGHGLSLFALAALAGEAAMLIAAVTALLSGDAAPAASAAIAAPPARVLRLSRALPYAANGLLAVLYNRVDVLIVGGLAAAGQLALYAPASRIQDALYLIPSSLESVAFPVMARVFNSPQGIQGVAQLVRRFALAGLAVSIPLTCACYVYTPQLLRYGLGPGYGGAANATRILIWYLPVACLSAPMITALAACGRVIDTTKVFVVAAGVAISMHLALDARWGAVGGALASWLRDPFALAAAYLLAHRAGISLLPAALWPRRRIIEPEAV